MHKFNERISMYLNLLDKKVKVWKSKNAPSNEVEYALNIKKHVGLFN